MDLFDALKSAFRRWYVLLPILILTAVLALVVNSRKTTEYSASVVLGVTTPATAPVTSTASPAASSQASNPLVTNGGTTLISNLLTIALQDQAVARAVVQAGGTPSYTVSVLERGASGQQLPVLTIDARGPDADAVQTSISTLIAQANSALVTIQSNAGVAESRYARTFVVQPATAPNRSFLSTARGVGIVVVVGVVVALVLAAAFDNVASRRSRSNSYENRHAEVEVDPVSP